MDESNICVISLDALNLNFLQSRYQQNLKQPLSRIKNSNEFCTDFYYEFELHKEEEFDINKEKSSNQELVYITCHICKKQVPQNFYHEHKYSVKHEINTKIANLAVQRLQKHLNYNYEIVNVPTNASTHFCPVCVTVMDSVEKKSHENSMGHKNSVIVEKFLNEFLNLYENPECQTDSSTMSNTLNTNRKNEMDVTIKKVANISNISDCSNENAIQKECVNEDEETIMSMKDYLILLKEKFKTEFIKFKEVNENDLVIKAEDGNVVRVTTDSFHSFKEIGPRTIQCAICQEVIVTSKDKHILTNKHMELLWSLPLEDMDCLRHIDKTWNHCVLCNLGFENVDSHLLSAEHENNLQVCVLLASDSDETNEEASTSSSVSGHNDINKNNETQFLHSKDLSTQDVNENQKLSKDTEKNKSLNTVAVRNESYDLNQISTGQMDLVENVHNKEFCTYCNVFISKKGLKKHTDTSKHCMNTWSDFHYFMKVIDADDTDYYLCRVCDEKVAKPIHEVKKHVTSPKHLQNYNASLIRNNIKKVGKDLFFCCLCSVKILIKNEILHMGSKIHKDLIDLEAQNPRCAESKATTSYCLVDKNLKAPQLQLKTEIKKEEEKEGMKDTKKFFCDICNVFVPNAKHNIETHIKGGPHIKNMEKMFDKKVDVEEKGTVKGKINMDNAVDKNKVLIDNLTKETNISHINISNTFNISSIRDCSNENAIQKECVNEDEETIMSMKDYLILLKEKFKTEFIEFKVVNENGLVIKTVDGSLVRVNTDSFHSFKEIGPKTMECAICQEVIVTSKKPRHILTNKHMELLWSLPLENKNCMRHIDKTWNHCVLCNLGFENVDSHLLSAEHEDNLQVCVLYASNNDKTNEDASTSSSVSGHNDINKNNESQFLHSEDLSTQDVNEYQKLSKHTEKNKSLNIVAVRNESYDLNQISTGQMDLVENVHNKEFCTYCNVFISKKGLKKHTATSKHCMNTWSDFHYFMKVIDADDTDYYLCRVCDEKVAKPIHEVKKHATSPKHLQNYNASLIRNNIKKVGKDLFFCCLCSVKILIKNEILHMGSTIHKNLIDLEAQNPRCAESKATTSYCLVDKNLKAPQLQLKTEIKKEGMKDTNKFFCDICNVFVPNTKYNIETHIKGGPHIKNMEKMFDKKVDVEEKGTVKGKINMDNAVDKNKVLIDNLTKETNISTDKKLGNNYYNLQKTKNAHILKCLVCDVFITINETNIATHVNGLNHLNNYTIIMETNRLEIKDNDVYCNVCSVHISIGNEISHCKGKRHASNLAATTIS